MYTLLIEESLERKQRGVSEFIYSMFFGHKNSKKVSLEIEYFDSLKLITLNFRLSNNPFLKFHKTVKKCEN
jgi:hypothetical protein